ARSPPWRRWSRRSGPDLSHPCAPPRPRFAAQDRWPCARSRGSSSRSRQPCELSRLPRIASVAVQCHVASLFDTPNLFERVISLGLRVPECCQTVADHQLSKRHARQLLRPRFCFQPPRVRLRCRGLHRHVTWLVQLYIKRLSCGKATRKSVRVGRAVRLRISLSTP